MDGGERERECVCVSGAGQWWLVVSGVAVVVVIEGECGDGGDGCIYMYLLN